MILSGRFQVRRVLGQQVIQFLQTTLSQKVTAGKQHEALLGWKHMLRFFGRFPRYTKFIFGGSTQFLYISGAQTSCGVMKVKEHVQLVMMHPVLHR